MKGKLIWFVLGLAFLLRFISLTSYPAGFNADEASFGYDAYSILHTGRDQWGNFLPIVLKSFGDYKSPVYSYLAIPSIAVFGLNVFATRLPNVIIGTLAIYVIYLLSNKLFNKKFGIWNDSRPLVVEFGILPALLLAINPWAVMISRGAFEFNLITLFIPLGIYLFLEKRYSLSALVFGINMFTYHSAKMITPLIVVGLILIFRKELVKVKVNKILIPLFVFLIFFVGMIYTFKIGGGVRVAERSITSGALEQGFTERMAAIAGGQGTAVSKLLHNKYEVIFVRFINNYFQYLSPRFLFVNGAGSGSYGMIPGMSTIYFVEGILFIGIVPLLLLSKKSRKLIALLILWLLITPLPAAMASGIGYSGNRASAMIPVLQIIESFGLLGWYMLMRKLDKRLMYLSVSAVLILGFFNIATFVQSYFKVPSNDVLKQTDYGNLEVSDWLKNNSNGKKIILSRSLSEPQIFIAFNQKWSPIDYQNSTKNWKVETWVDQIPEYSLGDYTIKSIDWKKDWKTGYLIAVRADELPKNIVPVKTFYFPDGSPNICVVDPTKEIYAKVF